MSENKRLFDLPETKGAFQLKGIVSGVEKDNFYKEFKTKTQKDMRVVNFGVSYKDKETLYINLQGMEQENVYFSKKGDKGQKAETVKVAWKDRYTFNREGFKLIGKNIGVRKKVDNTGKTVNDKKILTDFDACKEISEYLKDGNSVFTRGALDYSSYIDNAGNKKVSIKLIPGQVSLCKDIDFKADDYEQQNDFNQVIIFMGIDKEKDSNDKDTGRFVVSAKIVTYSSIEDVEFIIVDSKLANVFRKRLHPYNAIKVSGHIISSIKVEEVEDDDNWGESDALDKIISPAKREFIITGAKGSSIDTELYTKEAIEDAMSKIARANKANTDYGDNDDSDDSEWGALVEDDDYDSAWD